MDKDKKKDVAMDCYFRGRRRMSDRNSKLSQKRRCSALSGSILNSVFARENNNSSPYPLCLSLSIDKDKPIIIERYIFSHSYNCEIEKEKTLQRLFLLNFEFRFDIRFHPGTQHFSVMSIIIIIIHR